MMPLSILLPPECVMPHRQRLATVPSLTHRCDAIIVLVVLVLRVEVDLDVPGLVLRQARERVPPSQPATQQSFSIQHQIPITEVGQLHV